jgi:hypothetical protein
VPPTHEAHHPLVLFAAAIVAGNSGCGSNEPTTPPPNAPTITAISPSRALVGGAAFTLTVDGTNFVAASVVSFAGHRSPRRSSAPDS